MQLSVFAIVANGEVKNTIVGEYGECDAHAKATYGPEAFAVETYSMYYPPAIQCPVMPGDTFSDGYFYRNGAIVQTIPTPSQAIDDLSNQIDDIIIAITPEA